MNQLDNDECVLCKALINEKDKILYEDEDCFILPTKELKGHHKRIMVITKKHIPYKLMMIPYERMLLAKLIKFSKNYFDEEPTFAICDSTYCTIPEHWHKIACDWFGIDDIEQLHYTPHIAIRTKIKWEPKKVKS